MSQGGDRNSSEEENSHVFFIESKRKMYRFVDIDFNIPV